MPKNILSIWKIALLGGLLAFSGLFWLNDSVGYSAKSAILINGHNGNQDDVLAKTVAAFGDTDVFIQRTVNSTRFQESMLGQMDGEVQLSALEQVSIRGGKKGGLVTVTAVSTDKEIAAVTSMESMETLSRMSRLYLGGTTELTTTVIDKAIVTKGLIQPWVYIAKSVITALVLFFILLLIEPLTAWFVLRMKQLLRSTQEGEKEEIHTETPDQRFVPQKLDPTFLYSGSEGIAEPMFPQPKASEVLNKEVYGKVPEPSSKTPLQSVSVSVEDLPFTFETPMESPSSETPTVLSDASEASEDLPAEKEPTVLEYKRRLNELLAQK